MWPQATKGVWGRDVGNEGGQHASAWACHALQLPVVSLRTQWARDIKSAEAKGEANPPLDPCDPAEQHQ